MAKGKKAADVKQLKVIRSWLRIQRAQLAFNRAEARLRDAESQGPHWSNCDHRHEDGNPSFSREWDRHGYSQEPYCRYCLAYRCNTL